MTQLEKQKWNERYKEVGFAFGSEPNAFFKESLMKYKPASILLPAEGEGRNAVFAAQLGWNVTAFDLSDEGRSKAMALAKEKNVTFIYAVDDGENLTFEQNSFDAIGLIYAHFDPDKKEVLHRKLNHSLKAGGVVIFEAFSKEHLEYRKANPTVGGPTDVRALYSEEEIKKYFNDFEIIYLSTEVITLSEGRYHDGEGSVVRFIGKKNAV